MKQLRFFIVLFVFTVSAGAMAQYGGYGNPYGPGGVDRSMLPRALPKGKSNKKKEKKDIIDITVEQLDKKLNLDDFQKAAVKTIYTENKDEIMGLAQLDMPDEAIKEKGRAIADKIDKDILAILSPEQAKTYRDLIAERNKL